MARPKSTAPAYTYHISGQACVRLDGKDFYLGKHGTPESYARYHALLAEYNANGMKAPGDDQTPTHQAETSILVKHVTADFRVRILPRYENNEGQHNRYKNLLRLLDKQHGESEVDQFGPRALEALRDGFIEKGNCRRYCNDLTRMLVKIIKHGVARELVGPERIVALEALAPLRPGDAKDNPKRTGVSLALVTATLPHLAPVVADLVRLQLATAMRPSELHRMTPADIDRTGEVWFYRPEHHKTEHHGKTKAVPILGDAVRVLSPYLFGDPDELCFVTTLGTPWNKDNYRRHIARACKDNDLEHWTPYQLRHTAGQHFRDMAGPEATQAMMGHARLSTTEIYAKASESRAIEAAKVAPKLG